MGERDAPERCEQHVGHGGEPETELIGTHGFGRGAVCEEVELTLLDAVLYVAADAVELLVKGPRPDPPGAERGNDEAGVGAASEVITPRPSRRANCIAGGLRSAGIGELLCN